MLAALVNASSRAKVTPIVVDMVGDGEISNLIRAAGIPVHELGMKHAIALPLGLMRLAKLIRHLKPQVIQSWLYYADLLTLWALELSGRRNATRLYWGVRCSDMDQSHYGPALRWAIAACVRRSSKPDAVVANSFAGRAFHRTLGYQPRAFPVISNGIDTNRFRPDHIARAHIRATLGVPDSTSLVIHAARVDPMKDHAALLAVATAMPEVRFILVGSNTQKLATPPNAISLGSRSDMPTLYAAADALISTSAFGEGFSNVIGEAMASGLPVVATDVGDARRIIGATGMIVPPRDTKSMASGLHALLGEPGAQHRARANACRAQIETHYSLSRAVTSFNALHVSETLPDEDNRDMSAGGRTA
jgi:glycosyltransferase involved in cell wall biosynthesis